MTGFGVVIFTSILSFISLFFVAIFAAAAVYSLISYVFQGISIMCMGKNRGYKTAFTAWIPFYNKYVLGKIAGNPIIGGIAGMLSFVSICSGVLFICKEWAEIVVFAVFVISLMTTFILDAVIAHNIYTSRTNRYGDVLSVLHVLSFGLLRLIFLFARRNKKEQVPASI